MISSPRYIRPDTIIVKNYMGEINNKATYLETKIKYVRVDTAYGIRQSQKGIDSDDKIQVVIDMNDLVAIQDKVKVTYINSDNFKQESGAFTFQNGKDLVSLENGQEFTINTIKEVKALSKTPEFIELTLK